MSKVRRNLVVIGLVGALGIGGPLALFVDDAEAGGRKGGRGGNAKVTISAGKGGNATVTSAAGGAGGAGGDITNDDSFTIID